MFHVGAARNVSQFGFYFLEFVPAILLIYEYEHRRSAVAVDLELTRPIRIFGPNGA